MVYLQGILSLATLVKWVHATVTKHQSTVNRTGVTRVFCTDREANTYETTMPCQTGSSEPPALRNDISCIRWGLRSNFSSAPHRKRTPHSRMSVYMCSLHVIRRIITMIHLLQVIGEGGFKDMLACGQDAPRVELLLPLMKEGPLISKVVHPFLLRSVMGQVLFHFDLSIMAESQDLTVLMSQTLQRPRLFFRIQR